MTKTIRKGLVDSMLSLGVAESDIVMVHTDVSRLLRLPSVSDGLQLLRDALLEAVPFGTVVVPTFTYGFCQSGEYDVGGSRSEVGLFTEFFRRDPRAVRSSHPIFSVAAIGPDLDYVCRHLSPSSYAAGSVFERLWAADAKILFFDVPPGKACTFAHFPEQKLGVPYRFSKWFRGTVTVDGRAREGEWELYVRDRQRWDFAPEAPEDLRYPKDLAAAGCLRSTTWEGLQLAVATARGVHDVVTAGIHADAFYLLPRPPCRRNHRGSPT